MFLRHFPNKECGGIRGWNWIDTDFGAWEGPKVDWELHHYSNIKKFVSNFGTVVQAGGNQGMYPRLLSRMFNKVYTFEPDPLNFKTLVTNCDQDNIVKMQAALGAANGFCKVTRLTMQNTGMHKTSPNQDEVIPMISLDTIFPDHFKVDLIMLDLETYEFYALMGMGQILERNRPVLFIERPSQEIHTYLDPLGYKKVADSSMDAIFVAS